MQQRTKALSVLGAAALAVAVPVSGIFTASQTDVERALVYLDEIHHAEQVVDAQAEAIHRWELELRTLLEEPAHPPTDPVGPPIHPPDPTEPPIHPPDPVHPPDPTEPPLPPTPGEYLSVSRDQITWTFASSVSAVQTITGDWLVPAGTVVTNITPKWSVHPTLEWNGRPWESNGSMLNPGVFRGQGQDQGYDSSMYAQYGDYYRRALNVAARLPYTMRIGDSIISSVSVGQMGQRPQMQSAAVLTAVATMPTVTVFRPGIPELADPRPRPVSDVSFALLANFEPLPGGPSIDSVIDGVSRVYVDHVVGWTGRYCRPIDNMEQYGREFSDRIGIATLYANCNIDPGKKQQLVYNLVQIGLDYYWWAETAKVNGQAKRWMAAAGGHLSGRKWLVLFAGLVLNDPDVIRMGGDFPISGLWWQEDGQTFVVSANDLNIPGGGYTANMIGTPEWGIGWRVRWKDSIAKWISTPPFFPGTTAQQIQSLKYRRCCSTNTWHAQTAAVLLMDAKEAWDHDVHFDYMTRYIVTEGAIVDRGADPWTLAWTPWTLKMLKATNLLPGIN